MFFFALFGVRPRLKDAESPERVVVPCPVCLGERNFERKQARTWFELFFVPIFPIGAVRDLFTCVTCGVGLEPEIVRSRAAPRVSPSVDEESATIHCLHCGAAMRRPRQPGWRTLRCDACGGSFEARV